MRGHPQEHPGLRLSHIDVDGGAEVPDLLLSELAAGAPEPASAGRSLFTALGLSREARGGKGRRPGWARAETLDPKEPSGQKSARGRGRSRPWLLPSAPSKA